MSGVRGEPLPVRGSSPVHHERRRDRRERRRVERRDQRRENRQRGRRQGIFWIVTVPYPNAAAAALEAGTLPHHVVWTKGQREKGENSGYEHYQFVLALDKKASYRTITEMFGEGIHAELSRSESAAAYCTKEQTRVGTPWEWGVKPIRRNSGSL